jgi:3'(2'), 5'-bisphosphate nucleotidase
MEAQAIQNLLRAAEDAAREAGRAIMNIFNAGNVDISLKKDESPVTRADRESHAVILRVLRATGLPVLSEEGSHIPYIQRKEWNLFWLIDPLDGTREFIKGLGEFTVNIALVERDHPIAGVVFLPLADLLYSGAAMTGVTKSGNGIVKPIPPLSRRIKFEQVLEQEAPIVAVSRSHMTSETTTFIARFKNARTVVGGSSMKFMLLLENKADIYPRLGRTMEWDTAAAHALLNACNRGVYHLDLSSELSYNKPELWNPDFIAF